MADQPADDATHKATHNSTNRRKRSRTSSTNSRTKLSSRKGDSPRAKPRQSALHASSRNLVSLAPLGVLNRIGLIRIVGGDTTIDNSTRHASNLPDFSGNRSHNACPRWFQPVRSRRPKLPLRQITPGEESLWSLV